MSEIQSKTKCLHCGYPIEIGEHAFNCPNNKSGESGLEQEKEQNSETSSEKLEFDVIAEQVKKEEEIHMSTIQDVASLQEELGRADPEIPPAEMTFEPLPPMEEIKQQIELMTTKAQNSLNEFEDIVEKKIHEAKSSLQEIELVSEQDAQKLNDAMANIKTLFLSAKQKRAEIFRLSQQASEINKQYISAVLKQSGYNNFEEVSSTEEELYERKGDLRGKLLGSLRHRGELKQIDNQHVLLRNLSGLKYSNLTREIEYISNSYRIKRNDLLDDAVFGLRNIKNNITDRYSQVLWYSHEKSEHKRIELSEETQTSLGEDMAQRYLEDWLSEDEDFKQKMKPKFRDQIIALIKLAQEINFDKINYENRHPYLKDSSRNEVVEKFEELMDKLPYLLEKSLNRQFGREHNQISYSFEDIASYAKYELPDMYRKHEQANSIERILLKIKEIYPDDSRLADRGLAELRDWRSKGDNFDEFVPRLDMRQWKVFKNNEHIREMFGQADVEAMDEKMLDGIMNEILTLDNADARVSSEYKLMEYKTPEAIRLFIFSAFNERGYQNQRPFMSRRHGPGDPELSKYVKLLTDQDIIGLENQGMTDVINIINLIKKNPNNFDQKTLKSKDGDDEKDNPVFQEINHNMLSVGMDYIEKHPMILQRILFMLQDVESDLGKLYPEIESMVNNPPNSEVESRLPSFMLDKIKQGDSKILKMWMDRYLTEDLKEDWISKSDIGDPIIAITHDYDYKIPELLKDLDRLDKSEGEKSSYRRKYSDYILDYNKTARSDKEEDQEEMEFLPEEYEKFNESLSRLLEQDSKTVFDSRALLFIAKNPDKINNVIILLNHRETDYIGGLGEGFLNNIEKIAGNEEQVKATLNYTDRAVKDSKKDPGYKEYNWQMLSNKAINFIADHPEKIEAVLELEELGLFDGSRGGGRIFTQAERLLLNKDSFNKFKEYVTLVKSDSESNRNFFLDSRIVDYLAEHPESMDDIPSLKKIVSFEDEKLCEFVCDNIDRVLIIPTEKREAYFTVMMKIESSPSQEMQRLRDQLMEQIISSDDPVRAYEIIEGIFIKNNLPLVGKVYRVFSELNPSDDLSEVLENNSRLSPYLRQGSDRRRYYTIYKDLLRVHIDSANRSLKEFIEVLQSGQEIMNTIDEKGIDNLNEKEGEQAQFFLDKLQTLYDSSQLVRVSEESSSSAEADLAERYGQLQQTLKIRDGQTVTDRIAEMFLKPLGYGSMEEVIVKMKQVKIETHQRSLEMVDKAGSEGKIDIQSGDLLKGVNHKYFGNIMQNGSVAKDYLGASADSDMTPLDTDLSLVLEHDIRKGNEGAIDNSIAKNFGDLLFVVKDRGQYQTTDAENIKNYDKSKYELFNSGDENHYGIRTGFASTEIDYMIVQDRLLDDEKNLNKTFFEIAKNGFYIPVVDKTGKIIFTPEQYQEMNETFEGLEKFDGPDLDVTPTEKGDIQHSEVNKIAKSLRKDRGKVDGLSDKIRSIIKEVLHRKGIELKSEFDTSLLGAELMDTGSTSRHTNMSGDYDFDLALRLDDADIDRSQEILEEIKSRLNPDPKNVEIYEPQPGRHQLRAIGSKAVSGEPVDVDVGIIKKSELAVFGSHDAVSGKLNWIKENLGEKVQEQVVANIILAKQILKKGKAYKKLEHGGIGGIGVENWILLHGGNVTQAFESFRQAAYEGDKRIPFPEFQKKYKVLDAGVNVQKLRHDNYITNNLSEKGYQAMLDTIEEYLASAEE